jgi:hypothetical protein
MSLDPTTYKSIIESHVAMADREHKEWDQLRAMYRCQQWNDSNDPSADDLRTETGSVYAYTDTMIASIVPPNPQVTCNARKPAMADAAKYREALVNDCLRRSKADLILWKLATHGSVYPRGILKAVWNKRLRRPDFIVVDPRNFFFDLTAARYEDVRYVIEAFPLTEAEFNARVHGPKNPNGQYDANVAKKVQFGSYPAWLKDPQSGRAELDDKLRKVFKWTVVFEVFDFTTPRGRYYHFLLGQKEPLFEGDLPYVFLPNPYGLLTFNDNLEDAGGLADAKIVKGPVERLDELRTLKLRFAQSTIPVTILNEAEVDDPEATADQLANANSPGDMVRVKVKNGRSIGDVIGQTPTSVLSPAFDQMDQTLDNEILYRLGMPQYSRGVAGTSQVATELALVDAALRTRQGRRSELVNHVIVFMAKAIVGLYEEYMTGEDLLPVRLGPGKFLEIARQHLAARNPEEADAVLNEGGVLEEPLDIDFEVVPYSPVENSKTAQLQKLEKFMPVFLNNPLVKQEKLLAKLADLLDVGEDLVTSEQELIAKQKMAQQAAAGLAPGQSPIEAGPPPGGLEEGPPVEAGATSTMAALKGGNLPTAVPAPPGISTGARPGMSGGAGFSTPGS